MLFRSWRCMLNAVDWAAVRALVDLDGAVDHSCVDVGPLKESLQVGYSLVGNTYRLLNCLGHRKSAGDELECVNLGTKGVDLVGSEGNGCWRSLGIRLRRNGAGGESVPICCGQPVWGRCN